MHPLKTTALFSLCALLLGACCRPPEPGDFDEPEAPAGEVDDDTLSERGNENIASFRTAKGMIDEIFEGQETTFYCGCRYAGKKIDHKSCGYKVRKNKSRASRIEIEHVVPAAAFGQDFRAWHTGHPECLDSKGEPYKGRRCAEKMSLAFRHMEADLFNLQPSIGEVNGDRSDKDIAEIPGEARDYGECDVEIDEQGVEPRPSIRGDVARTYMYMDWAYPGHHIIHPGNRALIEAWHEADPVDDNERERARRVTSRQGNTNPFIK